MAYQLLLTDTEGRSRRSGVVFCADDASAKASALALLRADPAHGAVQVLQEGREVAHVRRRDLEPARAPV